jgi:hypothetical protein
MIFGSQIFYFLLKPIPSPIIFFIVAIKISVPAPMARHRRAAPPPQQSSSSEGEEKGSPRAPAAQMPPEKPQPDAAAAAADGAESSEEEDCKTEADMLALQKQPVSSSPVKAAAAVLQSESDAAVDEEDDAEPVQKKAAAAKKSKTVEQECRKRSAPDSGPFSKGKKANADVERAASEATRTRKGKKAVAELAASESTRTRKGKKAVADVGRAASEATPTRKGKKAVAELAASEATRTRKGKKAVADVGRAASEATPTRKEKKAVAELAASEATPTRKGKKPVAELEKTAPGPTPSGKAKKPGSKLGKTELDSPPRSRSTRVPWSKEDSMKVMEALVAHFKSKSELPATNVLLAAVGGRLARKDCTTTILYEKVRSLNKKYNKKVRSGVMPSGEDDLQMYHLSEVIWGEKAQKAMAAATGSKKGLSIKDKMNGNSKGGALKEVTNQSGDTQQGNKGQTINGKRKMLSRKDAKTGTENGDVLMEHKKRKIGKEKMDVGDLSLMPKASTGSGMRAEEEVDKEVAERCARVQRSFVLLQNMYPCLAFYIERIKSQHPCGETLLRAFKFISDENAKQLESMIKEIEVSKVKAQFRRDKVVKDLQKVLIGLA